MDIYAMKALMTRDIHKTGIARFFEFFGLELGVKEKIDYRARIFAKKGRENDNWVLNKILQFVRYQKDRADRKEIITAATIKNYVKNINFF
jgi:hypothetical protein